MSDIAPPPGLNLGRIRARIFKTGRHTDSRGRAADYTQADIDNIAAAYDPLKNPAPLAIGHSGASGDGALAWGWVDKLEATPGGDLFAEIGALRPEVVQAFRDKHLTHFSIGINPPGYPSNTGDGWELDHVAALGKWKPAIHGLGELQRINFSGGGGCRVFEFSAGKMEFGTAGLSTIAMLLRKLREWLIVTDGLKAADEVLPNYEIEFLADAARAPASQPAEFSGVKKETVDMETETAPAPPQVDPLAAQRAELEQRERALAQRETAAFAAQLEAEGRILPAETPAVQAMLISLDGLAPVQFSAAPGSPPQPTAPSALLRGFLQALPPRVDFSERAPAAGAPAPPGADVLQAATGLQTAEFSAGSIKELSEITALQQQNGCSYAEALDAYTRGQRARAA